MPGAAVFRPQHQNAAGSSPGAHAELLSEEAACIRGRTHSERAGIRVRHAPPWPGHNSKARQTLLFGEHAALCCMRMQGCSGCILAADALAFGVALRRHAQAAASKRGRLLPRSACRVLAFSLSLRRSAPVIRRPPSTRPVRALSAPCRSRARPCSSPPAPRCT